MKKQTKNGYSLTAKERKTQRRGTVKEQKPAHNESGPDHGNDAPAGMITVAGSNAVRQRGPKNKTAVIVCAVFLAVVLIVLSVLTITVFMPLYSYRKINNPVAVITLSTGEKIELEIFEKECPYAATNFLYLAQIKFFDNAIIFDTTNQFVRFGEYQNDDYKNTEGLPSAQWAQKMFRSMDDTFIGKITDITKPSISTSADSIFDYRLSKDTSPESALYAGDDDRLGYISNMLDNSGTSFQLCGLEGAQTHISSKTGSGRFNNPGQVLGKCIGDSIAVIERISAVANQGPPDNGAEYWTGPKETIRIKGIKLYKMDRVKWRDFHWDNFFQPNSNSGHVYWSGGSGLPRF